MPDISTYYNRPLTDLFLDISNKKVQFSDLEKGVLTICTDQGAVNAPEAHEKLDIYGLAILYNYFKTGNCQNHSPVTLETLSNSYFGQKASSARKQSLADAFENKVSELFNSRGLKGYVPIVQLKKMTVCNYSQQN